MKTKNRCLWQLNIYYDGHRPLLLFGFEKNKQEKQKSDDCVCVCLFFCF
jgi:hypothetical protein